MSIREENNKEVTREVGKVLGERKESLEEVGRKDAKKDPRDKEGKIWQMKKSKRRHVACWFQ